MSKHSCLYVFIIIVMISFFSGETYCYESSFDKAMDSLTQQITSEIIGSEKKKVAVVDFTNLDGKANELGRFIAEEILNRLFKTKEIQAIERRFIKRVMGELKLQKSGLIDERSARKLGKLLGVDALCMGTIAALQGSVKINARLIDVETGNIFAVASDQIDKKDLPIAWNQERSDNTCLTSDSSKSNYIRNGGFQQRFDYWTRSIGNIQNGFSQAEIVSFSHGNSGKALHLRHRGEGYIQYFQAVPVTSPDLLFTASFQASSKEGAIHAFSGSGAAQIGLQYFDAQNNKLGETIIINYVKNPFADTPLFGVPRRSPDTYKTHYIEFSGERFQQNFQINIRQEIETNLLGVNPESIKFIAVILWCGANHAQAGSEFWVTDLSLKGI